MIFKLSQSQSQLIKGVAIVMVLLSHIHRICSLPHVIEKILNPCGYLGVALFLFVSGYGCMCSSSPNNCSTLGRRICRIIVPLSITTFVSCLLMVMIGKQHTLRLEMLQAFGLNNELCNACWYITFQYVCYISFFLLGRMWSFFRIWLWGAIVSFGILLISIFCEINGLFVNLWGLNAFSFTAGVIIANMESPQRADYNMKHCVILFCLFVVLFAMVYYLFGNPDEYLYRNPLKSLVSLTFVILVYFSFASWTIRMNNKLIPVMRVFIILGQYSYYIYLIHAFWIFCFGEMAFDASLLMALLKLTIVIFLGSKVLRFVSGNLLHLVKL